MSNSSKNFIKDTILKLLGAIGSEKEIKNILKNSPLQNNVLQ